MMNSIYDFTDIEKIRIRLQKLFFYYILYAMCFITAIILSVVLIKNNLLLTVIFAFLLLLFILFSICFWKIKYGILDKYRSFLDNLETGKRDDYLGVFKQKTDDKNDEGCFDIYIFNSSAGEKNFLVRKEHPICFEVGKKYHLTHVGKYLFEWKIVDLPQVTE